MQQTTVSYSTTLQQPVFHLSDAPPEHAPPPPPTNAPALPPRPFPTISRASSFGTYMSDPPTPCDELKEEDLECLAEELAFHAAAAEPAATLADEEEEAEGPESALTGAYSGLRRRFTTRGRSETPEEQAEEVSEARKALDELEDIELAEFLERVGSRMHEVKIAVPSEKGSLPTREQFTSSTGQTDWRAFATTYINAAAEIYVPASLVAPPPRTEFSIKLSRVHLERVHVLCPPSTWKAILDGSVARVWRWQSPNTWKWCLQRLYPPTPEELHAHAKARVSRAKEAAEISRQVHSSSRLSIAKGIITGIIPTSKKAEASALVKGLHGSAMLGGLVGGAKVDTSVLEGSPTKEKKKAIATDSALARALGSAAMAGGVAAPQRVEIEGIRPTQPQECEPSATDEQGKVSAYKLMMEVLAVFGPPVQEMMSMASDLGEKVKNLFVHPDLPCIPAVLLRLAAICIFLIICPAWIVIKGLWAYLGLEFFVLFKLREDYPQWRRALMPIWWLLLDVPTDAEYAMYILQKRRRQNKPLRGSKTMKRDYRKARHRTSSGASVVTPTGGISSAIGGSSLATLGLGTIPVDTGSRSRPGSVHSKAGSENEEGGVGRHFALFNATPGILRISIERIMFYPTRGFRTIGLLKRKGHKSDEVLGNVVATAMSDGAESVTASFLEAKEQAMLDLLVDEVVGLKKHSLIGFDGIVISTRDGKHHKLSNVSKRDDAFNKIASLCTGQSSVVS
ncbi:hypothetical protein MNV49_006232 [Pseudohyphozyma bogoriensis]|nr:hypothetical protein MNV49_006232 [Pseudohyphozyma bogoriensis]